MHKSLAFQLQLLLCIIYYNSDFVSKLQCILENGQIFYEFFNKICSPADKHLKPRNSVSDNQTYHLRYHISNPSSLCHDGYLEENASSSQSRAVMCSVFYIPQMCSKSKHHFSLIKHIYVLWIFPKLKHGGNYRLSFSEQNLGFLSLSFQLEFVLMLYYIDPIYILGRN